MRNLILVLGDQLNNDSSAFDGFDRQVDAAWMSETPHELTHVWCHQLRIAFFLSAMRHFRDGLEDKGVTVHYAQLAHRPDGDVTHSFAERLAIDVKARAPAKLIVAQPGDYRVQHELQRAAAELSVPLEIRPDRTFYCSTDEFAVYASAHKTLLLENFYRWMRKKHGILLEEDASPVGGQWNFDKDNRRSFGRAGPGEIKRPKNFAPDGTTQEVLKLVAERFNDHPGSLVDFDLPVTRRQALALLRDFIAHRLSPFGAFQDAMWTGQAFLYHSRLSAVLNVKLITAREVIDAVIAAAEERDLPLASIEGFVRQIIGWREFMRGVYWLLMPQYAERNALDAHSALPHFYWDGNTDMHCMQQCTQQVIQYAYAHHIQRLMVLGNFSLLLGVDPLKFHEWHMAMYADAIDWVSLPNTLGMSQHADGGVVGTKPYAASGNYINRMSNYCRDCRYDPKQSAGDDACPFTTLYWEFLHRNRKKLENNPRMHHPMNYLRSKGVDELKPILQRADELRTRLRT